MVDNTAAPTAPPQAVTGRLLTDYNTAPGRRPCRNEFRHVSAWPAADRVKCPYCSLFIRR